MGSFGGTVTYSTPQRGGSTLGPHAGYGRTPLPVSLTGRPASGGPTGPSGGSGGGGGYQAFVQRQQAMKASRQSGGGGVVGGGGGASGGGGGFKVGSGGGYGGIKNTTQASPGLTAAQKQYQARLEQLQKDEDQDDPLLQEQVDRLRGRMSEDETERVTGRAMGRISDAADAERESMAEELNMSGRSGGGIGERDSAMLADREARARAEAAANIELAQQQRLDNLTLGGQDIMSAPGQLRFAKQAATTDLTTRGLDYALAPEQIDIAKKGLGIDQFRAEVDAAQGDRRLDIAEQQAQQDNAMPFFNLMQTAYGGYY